MPQITVLSFPPFSPLPLFIFIFLDEAIQPRAKGTLRQSWFVSQPSTSADQESFPKGNLVPCLGTFSAPVRRWGNITFGHGKVNPWHEGWQSELSKQQVTVLNVHVPVKPFQVSWLLCVFMLCFFLGS